jgi:hypothetical protein
VSIFIHKNLKFTSINSEEYCKYQTIEACALNVESTSLNTCVLRSALFWDNIPQERKSHQHHGGSLKSRLLVY